MGTLTIPGRKLRVLDFDTENRPITYGGHDGFTFSDITAIAWAWIDKDEDTSFPNDPDKIRLAEVEYELLYPNQDGIDLSRFLAAWEQADLVTCHNLRKHDLPSLNGRLLEQGLPPLHPKLVCDTYLDLKRRHGISASQESLAETLGIEAPKVGMSQFKWRLANRLLPEGLVRTRDRVVGDVLQHAQLRAELLRRQWLRPPRIWQP